MYKRYVFGYTKPISILQHKAKSPHTVTKTFENGHLSIIQISQDIIAHASKCATQHEEHEQCRNIHFKKITAHYARILQENFKVASISEMTMEYEMNM